MYVKILFDLADPSDHSPFISTLVMNSAYTVYYTLTPPPVAPHPIAQLSSLCFISFFSVSD